MADPHKMGYIVRWPLYGGHFNARDYPSHQVALSDIELVLRETLSGSLSIDPKSYDVRFRLSFFPLGTDNFAAALTRSIFWCIFKDYSVVLVIPDFYERTYVKDLIDILLVRMGFKQLCVQQASFSPKPLSFPAPETFSFHVELFN